MGMVCMVTIAASCGFTYFSVNEFIRTQKTQKPMVTAVLGPRLVL